MLKQEAPQLGTSQVKTTGLSEPPSTDWSQATRLVQYYPLGLWSEMDKIRIIINLKHSCQAEFKGCLPGT